MIKKSLAYVPSVFCLIVAGYLLMHKPAVIPMSSPPIEIEQPEPEPRLPLTLDDIQVTVIRLGSDITLLLDWRANEKPGFPFHIWIEAEKNNITLNSPSGETRTIEVILDGELLLYGSTLYHEVKGNRLAIDLQVKNGE